MKFLNKETVERIYDFLQALLAEMEEDIEFSENMESMEMGRYFIQQLMRDIACN